MLRFRSWMVLLLVRRPRGRWTIQMNRRIVRSPRLPKRCQCRPRLNEQRKRSGHPRKQNANEIPHCHSSSHSNHISMIHTLCTYNQSKTRHIPLPFRFSDTICIRSNFQFNSVRFLLSDWRQQREREGTRSAAARSNMQCDALAPPSSKSSARSVSVNVSVSGQSSCDRPIAMKYDQIRCGSFRMWRGAAE